MSTDISALRGSALRPVWKNIAVPFEANAGENTGRRCASSTGTSASRSGPVSVSVFSDAFRGGRAEVGRGETASDDRGRAISPGSFVPGCA